MDLHDIPKGLSVTPIAESDALILRVSGELDIATAAKLEAEMDAALAKSPKALYVDLSEVGFMDSTGLRLLISAQRRISESGGEFGVATGDSPSRRVIELTGMDEHLRATRDLADLTR